MAVQGAQVLAHLPPLMAVVAVLVPSAAGVPVEAIGEELRTAGRSLAAAWLLMSQPLLVEERTVAPGRPGRRPSPRPGRPVREVSLVDVRRAHRAEQPPDAGEGRKLGYRLVVAGHWKRVACGKGREERRLQWISEHVRGPEGAPLRGIERVHVWRR